MGYVHMPGPAPPIDETPGEWRPQDPVECSDGEGGVFPPQGFQYLLQ